MKVQAGNSDEYHLYSQVCMSSVIYTNAGNNFGKHKICIHKLRIKVYKVEKDIH